MLGSKKDIKALTFGNQILTPPSPDMRLITTIPSCLTRSATPADGRLHTPGGIEPKHELRVERDSFHGRDTDSSGSLPSEDPLLQSILRIVSKYKHEIDVVTFNSTWDEPGPFLLKALQDLRPHHIEMTSGLDEQCNTHALSHIDPPWPLKSFYNDAYVGDGGFPDEDGPVPASYPSCYAGIQTVVLGSPSAETHYFYPEGGATDLRSFTAIENNAVGVVANTLVCNPKMKETLRSLTIASASPCQDQGLREVKRLHAFLREARALVNLELVMNDAHAGWHNDLRTRADLGQLSYQYGLEDDEDDERIYADADDTEGTPIYRPPYQDLCAALPNALQTFSFRGPRNGVMLRDLDKWVECAHNPAWLPSLRSIAFKLDLNNVIVEEVLTKAQEEELDMKLQILLDLLTKRANPVKIVEPRDVEEMVYPVLI